MNSHILASTTKLRMGVDIEAILQDELATNDIPVYYIVDRRDRNVLVSAVSHGF